MRIIVATDNYYPNVNGASYFSQRLARELAARGHEVLAVIPSFKLKRTHGEIDGVPYVGLPSFPVLAYRGFRVPFPFAGVKNILREFKPDIVHVQDHFMIGHAVSQAALKMGIPAIGTNHFMPENLTAILRFHGALAKIFRKYAWKHFVSVYKKLDIVTTPTERAADLLKQIGLTKQVAVISNGINLKNFNTAKHDPGLKARYGLDDRPILLFVGRVDPEKNLDMVIKAVPQALKSCSFQFVVVGKGVAFEDLKKLCQKLGVEDSVRLLGFVPNEDLPGLYTEADCFMMAGTAELQSIATMEAMASGLPVIAVNFLALPELVQDGINGFLFELEDLDQLASKIVKMMSDRELQIMAQNSLNLIKKHDMVRVIEKYEQLYATVIKQ